MRTSDRVVNSKVTPCGDRVSLLILGTKSWPWFYMITLIIIIVFILLRPQSGFYLSARECEEKLRQAHKTKINTFNLLIYFVGAGANLKKDSTNYLVLYDVCSLIRVLRACQ